MATENFTPTLEYISRVISITESPHVRMALWSFQMDQLIVAISTTTRSTAQENLSINQSYQATEIALPHIKVEMN